MLWFVFAFLTAFFESMKAIFSKKSFKKDIDEYVVAWAFRFSALIFMLPVLFFIQMPPLGDRFWEATLIRGAVNVVTTILYMRALKLSDVSITHPMTAFSPLFLLLTAPIFLGEFPDAGGLIGVMLIIAGAYCMNISKFREGFFAPFKALLKEKGPRLMLIVAFLWSISTNYDKIGILNSSPLFWTIFSNFFLVILLFPIMMAKSKDIKKQILPNISVLALIGLASALVLFCQMIAFKMTLVIYVSAIKTTSGVISVLLGYLFFKEKNIKERLLGATIMVIGVLFIVLL